jgi:hypothetical protein
MVGTGLAFGSSRTVGQQAAGFTPWLLASTPAQYVRQLVQCGDTMYAVGTLSDIGQGADTYRRGNAFSFSATTGHMTDWDPRVNGMVHSIALTPDGSTAYLGGAFTSAGGAAADNLAAVDTRSGDLINRFRHEASSEVDTLIFTRGMLLVGGTFTSINGAARSRLASLSPVTGVPTTYADLEVTGAYPNTWTRIYNAQLSHAGDRLLVEGVFTSIGGVPRQQIAMLDLGDEALKVDRWYAREFDSPCQPDVPFFVRDAAWSPTDRTVFVAATGGRPASGPGSKRRDPRAGLCDAASAFVSRPKTVTHRWVNYTGCDSYYSVVADAGVVYFSGHERWANNGLGCDHGGPGSVPRPGIAALRSTTGRPLAWNPTRSLGFGAVDLVLTPAGLWVASDNYRDGAAQFCAGASNKGGICFLPR